MPGPEQSTRLILATGPLRTGPWGGARGLGRLRGRRGVALVGQVVGGRRALLDPGAGHVIGRARVVAAQERQERAGRLAVGLVAALVAGDRGQPGLDRGGRAARGPGPVDDQDLVAGLVQAPEAGAGGGHPGRLGQAQVADRERAVALVADGVAAEVLGHVALRSRVSWGRLAASGVSQRAVPMRPEASKASSTT